MAENPTPIEPSPPKESAFNFLLRELNISAEDIETANQERNKLKNEFGIVFAASQIDNWFLQGAWKPYQNDGETLAITKIDPISAIYPFLPPELQSHATGEIEHVFSREIVEDFQQNPGTTKTALKSLAKEIVLAFLSTDSAIEIHPETDLGGKNSPENIDAWDHFINFARYLALKKHNEQFILHKQPKNVSEMHESAHLTFAVIKTDEKHDAFIERLKSTLGNDYSWDNLTETAADIFWSAQRGFKEGNQHFMNFEMFFMSGYLDPTIISEIKQYPPDQRDEITEALSDMSVLYATKLHLEQITWMKKRYGISNFTLHAGPLGASLKNNQFDQFKSSLKILLSGLSAGEMNDVVLQIETQGLTKSQWIELLNDPTLKDFWGTRLGITLDLVHVEAEKNKFETITDLKTKADPASINQALILDPFDSYEEKPDLDFFLKLENRNILREVHVSKTLPTNETSFQTTSYIIDDHLPISDLKPKAIVPGFKETLKVVSAYNLTHKNDPDFQPIIIAQEATLSQKDVREMLKLCYN